MSFSEQIQHKIDTKTKPLGALGDLERLAKQICLVQQSLSPQLSNPQMLVFAGDHGIAQEGVSAFPQEVTWQMVMNFVGGGAAINVFCQQSGMSLKVIDAGVNHCFPQDLPIVNQKIAMGTCNFINYPAMIEEQFHAAMMAGREQVSILSRQDCNVVGFGEMGIANTTSATAIICQLTGLSIDDMTGRGTGLDDAQLAHKKSVLEKAFAHHGKLDSVESVLQTYGGFEIVQMVGAMLEAKEQGMVILVDGFIASAAYLAAEKLNPLVRENAVFCHQSNERGHKVLLEEIGVEPLLKLNMRLGEGSGAALAYPLLKSAVAFINDMASFESAGVSDKES